MRFPEKNHCIPTSSYDQSGYALLNHNMAETIRAKTDNFHRELEEGLFLLILIENLFLFDLQRSGGAGKEREFEASF